MNCVDEWYQLQDQDSQKWVQWVVQIEVVVMCLQSDWIMCVIGGINISEWLIFEYRGWFAGTFLFHVILTEPWDFTVYYWLD